MFWQPINTAPENEDILVCWAKLLGFNGDVCAAIHIVDEENGDDHWRTEANPFDGGEYCVWPEEPSHWMPLPESI